MSKLFLVHDFSPDSSALFAAFSQHAPLLAENSIELAPFNAVACEIVPTHGFLWLNRGKTPVLPAHVSAIWAAIAEKLDSGKNVLMFTRSIEPESHAYFWQHLPERVDLERHAPELLFIFGRPSLLLEQYHVADPVVRTQPVPQTHGERWLGSIAPAVSLIRERAGSARCEYLFNTAESPAGAPRLELFGQVFDFLGCQPPDLSHQDPSGAGFKSHQARRIFRALEVRGNAWPPLDMAACRAALLELDRDLPQEWVTPLSVRQEFARAGAAAVTALEALSGASPGSLAPPPAFAEEPQADLAAPISPALIEAFVARIPPAERESLWARLRNDRPLLNADHKALWAALSGDGEFSHMGEAVPPPELTVLTMTFNHENFIAQCMDSVLAQKTDFPVRHLVLDHCSSDGTAAIVAEYARKHPSIQPVLLSQHLPHENTFGLFQRCRSKYAALCDGADYFTEPTKLQRQVEM
ncbi:glycosyltransferase family A protein, partial [Desulfovibrio sp.]|uniref:glycosyltransferase family 2 protein n=1 Tax=Desulfovibrio sp. TaxID=885 RepID=UPI0023C1FA34